MSKLEFLQRPLVAFDANNKDHRRYFAEYLESGNWSKSPVRFIVPDDTGMDLPTMIKNRLCEHYINREFGGSGLTDYRADEMLRTADIMYKRAAELRKEAQLVRTQPRRV